MVAFNRFNRFRKGKGKAKKVVRPPPKKPMMSFAKRVNAIIARNVENKFTSNSSYQAPIHNITTTGTPPNLTANHTFFNWTAGMTIFDISQGVNVQQRIGNTIKVKKWIIKGLIQPANNGLLNTQMGYVDLYFGRLQQNITQIPNTLFNFYQNGATDITPTGNGQEQLFRINRDVYKIYYHKRFKLGVNNNDPTTGGNVNTQFVNPQANDYKTSATFGFDVCKYICKNKVLRYDEFQTTPQDADVMNLTMWAVFHPTIGNVAVPTTATTASSIYEINACSFAEFEDA